MIAPREQRFELQNFAGPLDLLLYLVQKEEVDIREVSLVRICDQYVEHLREADDLDIELAGEFFLMAATLMSIKARSLLPTEELDLEEELDPEEELIQQLLEYRKVKEATRDLGMRADARRLIHFSRPQVTDAGIPLEEVGVFHLIEAFRKVLEETGLDRRDEATIVGEKPMMDYVIELIERLRESPRIAFFQVFAGKTSRVDLIGSFLALLELVRAKVVRAVQEEAFGEISLEVAGDLPDNLTSLSQLLPSDEEPADADEEIAEKPPNDSPSPGGEIHPA